MGKEDNVSNSYLSEEHEYSDILKEPQIDMFFENGSVERDEEGSIRVLSLFSGCGGMDLGLEGGFICHRKSVMNNEYIDKNIDDDWVLLKRSLFRTVFACDILPEAKATWVKYFGRFDVNPEIYHLQSVVDLVKLHNSGQDIFPKNIDIVTGGFPCQDFSVAGKRKGFNSLVSHDGDRKKNDAVTEDNKGKLYLWMKEVIEIVRPKMFIAENVKGMVSLGDVKDIIQHDFSRAHDNDYIVLTPKVLHAANYGVPETRERVIFIGIKKSALLPEVRELLEKDTIPDKYNPYPQPTHNIGNDVNANYVTCNDVLGGLLEPEESKDLSHKSYSKAKFLNNGSQGQTEINMSGLGPTIRSEHHGNIEFRRLSAEHGGRNYKELEDGKKERRLSPRECALIQTFPPDFPFVFYKPYMKRYAVSPSSAYKVIGNAVPPLLAFNLAKRIEEVWPLYFGG